MTWADASSSLSSSSWPAASFLDSNEDSPTPSRNGPPIKTYEVRSHISLKLKIKQETRLSKVVHNKALDPGHQPSPAPQNAEPLQHPPPPASTPATQMNGGWTTRHRRSHPALTRLQAYATMAVPAALKELPRACGHQCHAHARQSGQGHKWRPWRTKCTSSYLRPPPHCLSPATQPPMPAGRPTQCHPPK